MVDLQISLSHRRTGICLRNHPPIAPAQRSNSYCSDLWLLRTAVTAALKPRFCTGPLPAAHLNAPHLSEPVHPSLCVRCRLLLHRFSSSGVTHLYFVLKLNKILKPTRSRRLRTQSTQINVWISWGWHWVQSPGWLIAVEFLFGQNDTFMSLMLDAAVAAAAAAASNNNGVPLPVVDSCVDNTLL